MCSQKSVKSVELVPGRDDDILDYLALPQVNTSAAIRAALRLLIKQDEGKQNMVSMLEEVLSIVKNGVATPKTEPKYNDPFLDKSL